MYIHAYIRTYTYMYYGNDNRQCNKCKYVYDVNIMY